MGNDVGISKFKYLSTFLEPGKYFTGHDIVRAIASDFVSDATDACITSKHLSLILRTSNYIRYGSRITVINDDIKSDYIIYFEADVVDIDNIDIIACSTKDINIIYRYKNGKEYNISDTIEDEFLDEYNLIKEIVKEIDNSLKYTLTSVLTYLHNIRGRGF